MSTVVDIGARDSAPRFDAQAFYSEREAQPQFYEKPAPANASLKVERSYMETTSASAPRSKVPAIIPISAWIVTSMTVILFNKALLTEFGFNRPVFLTTLHLGFATIATRILKRTTRMVDQANELEATGVMNRSTYLKKIVPIAALFSVSLVLSNWVYLKLSVSYIQMLKAITPVVVLAVSVGFGVKTASRRLTGIVSVISLGVFIASMGEVDFDALGTVVQLIAIGVESTRLVLIQILLSQFKMGPIVSLYYIAPACFLINAVLILPFTEGYAVPFELARELGPSILLLNAICTFALNLSSTWLIGCASGLVLTLAGVIKDILLIGGSFAILGSSITPTQIFGYAIALTGLYLFKREG